MGTPWKRVVTEGIILGGIGYGTTILFFALINLIGGRSVFHTPALLGSAFFYGVRDVDNVTIWAGPVIAFNGAYLVLFLLVGMLIAWLAAEAEHGPQFLYLSVFVLLFGALHLTAPAIALTDSTGSSLPLWSLMAAGVLAMIAIVAYLLRAHPRLRAELGEDLEAYEI